MNTDDVDHDDGDETIPTTRKPYNTYVYDHDMMISVILNTIIPDLLLDLSLLLCVCVCVCIVFFSSCYCGCSLELIQVSG